LGERILKEKIKLFNPEILNVLRNGKSVNELVICNSYFLFREGFSAKLSVVCCGTSFEEIPL
jgi:hypothetical protein